MYEEGKVRKSEQTGDVPGILRQLEQLLDSAGVPGELRSQVAESVRTSDVSRKTGTAAGVALALSDNARVILEQRYLRKDADDNPIETPEGLFRRVARAIAEGEAAGMRVEWENRFYDLLTSLKFLPQLPHPGQRRDRQRVPVGVLRCDSGRQHGVDHGRGARRGDDREVGRRDRFRLL